MATKTIFPLENGCLLIVCDKYSWFATSETAFKSTLKKDGYSILVVSCDVTEIVVVLRTHSNIQSYSTI